ncbi:protein C8orf37 homolog isoform X3 [Eurytemora carolleeae]|nr:protein C8orf37 homolog isoform X3 [Eurytemora carolleeae]|eukprot:XP_023329653.1 protein C8orf37 homolog isoform X3 [Eurytemora affinis]
MNAAEVSIENSQDNVSQMIEEIDSVLDEPIEPVRRGSRSSTSSSLNTTFVLPPGTAWASVTETPTHDKKTVSPCNNNQKRKKCSPVYLAGAISGTGHSTQIAKRACSNLLCVKCDLKVIYFDNMSWTDCAQYLFLRTNYPDRRKLSVELQHDPGPRAYCCQCSAVTIQSYSPVETAASSWICAKH